MLMRELLAIPKCKGDDRGNMDSRIRVHSPIKPDASGSRRPVHQRDASVRFQQVIHLRAGRFVAEGGLPRAGNGSEFNWSSLRNSSFGSCMRGSRRTPWPTRRIRTRSPSKRNSRGKRTAWLRRFWKSFAMSVLGVEPSLISNFFLNVASVDRVPA